MTDLPDANKGGETPDDASWQVEGGDSDTTSADNGLGDTVVKMAKVADGPKPTTGAGKTAASRTRKTATSQKAATGAAKPSIPKPVKKTATDDLMAAFDQPVPTKPIPVSTPSPAAGPSMAAPSMAMPRTPAPATARPPASVPVASMVGRPAPASAPRPTSGPVGPAAGAPKPATGTARRTRKARLRVARVDPWSVMKTVFLFSIAFGVMSWVATYLLWQVLLSSGLFAAINDAIITIISSPNNTEAWRIEDYLSANKVLGVTALLAVINVVISTALGTLGAFLYNLSANILGGLELTLAED